MPTNPRATETRLVHGPAVDRAPGDPVVGPVHVSSTYRTNGVTDYHDIEYIRFSNTPNQTRLAAQMADLEGAAAGLMTASGMAAVSAVLLTTLRAGDHLITTRCLYGGTQDFIRVELARLGVTHTVVDGDDPAGWDAAVRPNTRAVYVEVMSNPLLEVPDLPAVVRFARRHQLTSVIDNTFATPLNYRPCPAGFDLSVHSASKYLNGHGDLVAGVVLGRAELVGGVKRTLDHVGGSLDPRVCYLLERGLKTLAVRLREQQKSALRLAEFLEGHPAVGRVLYPGLPSHPNHARACELLAGFGGVLGFEVRGGAAAADAVLARLKLVTVAPSLGGTETLVLRPAGSIFAARPRADTAGIGISEALVRVSVGLESLTDLVADFRAALGPDADQADAADNPATAGEATAEVRSSRT